MRGGLVVVVACVLAPGSAYAGRSFFGWLSGSEVMPERSVELQNWLAETNKLDDTANASRSLWGVAPLIGITDQLELGLPIQIVWNKVPGMGGSTALHD